jgi:hypothetical protein
MTCAECHQEFTYADAADWAVLHHTGCCSDRCAVLNTLSQIWALDKSSLIPLLPRERLLFVLEDVLSRLRESPQPEAGSRAQ